MIVPARNPVGGKMSPKRRQVVKSGNFTSWRRRHGLSRFLKIFRAGIISVDWKSEMLKWWDGSSDFRMAAGWQSIAAILGLSRFL